MKMWRTLGLVLLIIQATSIFLHVEVEAQQQYCVQDDIRTQLFIQPDIHSLESTSKHEDNFYSSLNKDKCLS